MQNKINWISILQGWAMFLVVIGHVNLTGIFLDSQTPITSIIQKTIYSFHMPLFMFISGMLFWETRLKRDWNYKNILIDKAKRLLVPYFFFTVATFFIKLVASKFIYRPVDLNISYILSKYSFHLPKSVHSTMSGNHLHLSNYITSFQRSFYSFSYCTFFNLDLL